MKGAIPSRVCLRSEWFGATSGVAVADGGGGVLARGTGVVLARGSGVGMRATGGADETGRGGDEGRTLGIGVAVASGALGAAT
jgi:hypothetical protein